MTPLTATVLADADRENAGAASGVNNAIARIAGLLGIAAVGVGVASGFSSEATPAESVDALRLAMGSAAALLLLGGLIGLVGIRNPRRPRRQVNARECAGGQLVGQPVDAGQPRDDPVI